MSDTAPPLASRRILIVDDQPSIRGVLELALSEAGAEVWTAPDGKTALAALETGLPDIILLDLVMPGMNGWQVIETLAATPRTSRIPVVLETSAADFGSFDRAKKEGVAAFISKPFRLNEVVETCRRVLAGARPLQGRDARTGGPPTIEVRDPAGNLLGIGRLLDHGDEGAQMEIDTPLALAQIVTLTQASLDLDSRQAEVRWVTRVGERYHHGLRLLRR